MRASQPDDAAVVLAHAGVLIKSKVWTELIDLTVDWCDQYPDKTGILARIIQGVVAQSDEKGANVAETILRRVIASHADCVPAIDSLALLMHMQGRTDEAVELYEKVLFLEPDRLVAINNLAWILCEERNDYQRAMELVTKGSGLNPIHAALIDTRGMIHFRMGQLDMAETDFKKCIALSANNAPGLASFHFHLAKVYVQKGDKQQALRNLRKSIDLKGLSEEDLKAAKKLLKELMQ